MDVLHGIRCLSASTILRADKILRNQLFERTAGLHGFLWISSLFHEFHHQTGTYRNMILQDVRHLLNIFVVEYVDTVNYMMKEEYSKDSQYMYSNYFKVTKKHGQITNWTWRYEKEPLSTICFSQSITNIREHPQCASGFFCRCWGERLSAAVCNSCHKDNVQQHHRLQRLQALSHV